MSTDLTSYTTVLTNAIAAVTALIAATAGLCALLRAKRQPRILQPEARLAPAHAVIYVSENGHGGSARDNRMSGVTYVPQGSMTQIPRWVSSTRTPLIIISVLLVAILQLVLRRSWELAPVGEGSLPTIAEASAIVVDEHSHVVAFTLSGQADPPRNLSGAGMTVNVYAQRVGDVSNLHEWIKVGEGVVNSSGSWSAKFTMRGSIDGVMGDGSSLFHVTAVCVPTGVSAGNAVTLADLDTMGRSAIVTVAPRRLSSYRVTPPVAIPSTKTTLTTKRVASRTRWR
jgi:hypothetical protein